MKKIFFYKISSPFIGKDEMDFWVGERSEEIITYAVEKIQNTNFQVSIIGSRDLDDFKEHFVITEKDRERINKRMFRFNMMLVRDKYIKSDIDRKHFNRIISKL